MRRSNLILLSLGVAILIGIGSGYALSTEKYFVLSISNGKKEITEQKYYSYPENERKNHIIEDTFNTEAAFISGIAIIALGLMIAGIGTSFKKK